MLQILTAKWLFPGGGQLPIRLGAVVVQGEKILAVGKRSEFDSLPDAKQIDFGNSAILPGLVNAHTHLDLSGASQLANRARSDFISWVESVIQYRRGRSVENVRQDVRQGLQQLKKYGTTLVGDICAVNISQNDSTTQYDGIHSHLYRELISLDNEKITTQYAAILDSARKTSAHGNAFPAFSPHAPYTVNLLAMQEFNAKVKYLATHIGETLAELELLTQRSGPFVSFLEKLNAYHPAGIANSWQEFTRKKLQNKKTTSNDQQFHLLVHANYLPVDFPFAEYQAVVYCPRTHFAFGHLPHPFREFQKRGVNVCLGTDSLASNPDLDIFAEASFLYEKYGFHDDFTGHALLNMITSNSAKAMGFGDVTGHMQQGYYADLAIIPLGKLSMKSDTLPYNELFQADLTLPRIRFFRGQQDAE